MVVVQAMKDDPQAGVPPAGGSSEPPASLKPVLATNEPSHVWMAVSTDKFRSQMAMAMMGGGETESAPENVRNLLAAASATRGFGLTVRLRNSEALVGVTMGQVNEGQGAKLTGLLRTFWESDVRPALERGRQANPEMATFLTRLAGSVDFKTRGTATVGTASWTWANSPPATRGGRTNWLTPSARASRWAGKPRPCTPPGAGAALRRATARCRRRPRGRRPAARRRHPARGRRARPSPAPAVAAPWSWGWWAWRLVTWPPRSSGGTWTTGP